MCPVDQVPKSLDFEGIKALIPQRFPFLMIDKVTTIQPGEKVIATKNLTGNEWFYQGHFPTKAVTPGAMILEAMAQAGIIFFKFATSNKQTNVTYLLGGAKMRFLEPVFPGSQLTIEITPIKLISGAGLLNGEASVDGRIIAKGELALAAKSNKEW